MFVPAPAKSRVKVIKAPPADHEVPLYSSVHPTGALVGLPNLPPKASPAFCVPAPAKRYLAVDKAPPVDHDDGPNGRLAKNSILPVLAVTLRLPAIAAEPEYGKGSVFIPVNPLPSPTNVPVVVPETFKSPPTVVFPDKIVVPVTIKDPFRLVCPVTIKLPDTSVSPVKLKSPVEHE